MPLGKGKTQRRPKLTSRVQKGEIAVPKEIMSTSRQMRRLGETVANGIDRARFDVRGVIIGGGIAGILAGIVMAMAAMFYAAANGSGFFLPVRSIAATWYGANALLGGAGVLIAGLATHLGTSAFGGVVFAALPSSRKSANVALLSGVVWGVVVWAILSIAVMPWLNPTMYAGTVGSEPVWWFVLHLIYGGMLVLTPGLVRRVSARPSAAEVMDSRHAA
jgi:hypothetical protein